jgi:hypothetical protein
MRVYAHRFGSEYGPESSLLALEPETVVSDRPQQIRAILGRLDRAQTAAP